MKAFLRNGKVCEFSRDRGPLAALSFRGGHRGSETLSCWERENSLSRLLKGFIEILQAQSLVLCLANSECSVGVSSEPKMRETDGKVNIHRGMGWGRAMMGLSTWNLRESSWPVGSQTRGLDQERL